MNLRFAIDDLRAVLDFKHPRKSYIENANKITLEVVALAPVLLPVETQPSAAGPARPFLALSTAQSFRCDAGG